MTINDRKLTAADILAMSLKISSPVRSRKRRVLGRDAKRRTGEAK